MSHGLADFAANNVNLSEVHLNAEFARMVVARAREELYQERFRAAVEKEKQRLRTKRSLWDRLFPFYIHIVRKT